MQCGSVCGTGTEYEVVVGSYVTNLRIYDTYSGAIPCRVSHAKACGPECSGQ